MGRIHRYGQREDCLIFNFAATNTIEGRVLQRLLDKLQEIRDALDDDAVFTSSARCCPPRTSNASSATTTPGSWAPPTSKSACSKAWTRAASATSAATPWKGWPRRSSTWTCSIEAPGAGAGTPRRAGDHRPLPGGGGALRPPSGSCGTRRFLARPRRRPGSNRDSAQRNRQTTVPAVADRISGHRSRRVGSAPHTFEPGRTPAVLRRYERDPDWKLPALAGRYPRCSTDRETAEKHALEWITPGHPLFEAVRRHTCAEAAGVFGTGASFHSLQHAPARPDRLLPGVHRGRPGADHPRTALRGGRRTTGAIGIFGNRASSETSFPRTRRRRCPRWRPCPNPPHGFTNTPWRRSSKTPGGNG